MVGLRAPDVGWLHSHELLKLEPEALERYQWMVDRFSVTNPEDWMESSLRLEYRWSNENGAPRAPRRSWPTRRCQRPTWIERSPKRTMSPDGPAIPRINANLASRMQAQTCGLLREGKSEAAATLFEFAVSENPNDAAAHNNLGFCLMPSDPDRAWSHLRASELGYEPAIINIVNRVQCLALLGDAAGALALAGKEWGVAAVMPRMPAILWKQERGSVVVLGPSRASRSCRCARLPRDGDGRGPRLNLCRRLACSSSVLIGRLSFSGSPTKGPAAGPRTARAPRTILRNA